MNNDKKIMQTSASIIATFNFEEIKRKVKKKTKKAKTFHHFIYLFFVYSDHKTKYHYH